MAESWTLDDLKGWTRGLLQTHRVVAPVSGPAGAMWAEIQDPESVAWNYTRTAVSPREWLIPRHEPLFRYDLGVTPPVLEEPPLDQTPTVLLLLRPCDVAGLRALDAVMRWDYTDEGYEARRAATILVSLACLAPASKDACFCESLGIDPRFAPEADLVIRLDAGESEGKTDGSGCPSGYRVFAVSEAGRALADCAPRPFEDPPGGGPDSRGGPASGDAARATVGVPAGGGDPAIGTVPVDLRSAIAWLQDPASFDDPLWGEVADACVGCGACAYLCPSCHCFDVVDEGDWRRGARVRNWDSCAFGHFTAHATGHNPRPAQWNRWRQRVYHKFVYYPRKFGRLLCTGCGRCVDACPGGMDLIEVLSSAAARGGSNDRPGAQPPDGSAMAGMARPDSGEISS